MNETKRTLSAALSAIHQESRKATQQCYIHDSEGRYLSGIPYLWSAYGERAFIFADLEQAQELIKEFGKELEGCSVMDISGPDR